MDIFEERYFNFNRKLFQILGLWPYGPKTRNIRKYLVLCILFVMVIPFIASAIYNFSDIDRAMVNLMGIFICFLMFLKILAMIFAEDKMKALYRNIADNWLSITDTEEKKIVFEYSERGRKKTIYYFVFIQVAGFNLFSVPVMFKILDIIFPLSNPRPKIYVSEVELFLDREEYYVVYILWDVLTILLNVTVSVSVDTMFIVCIEHCCAFYAIIRYRLHNIKLTIINGSTETEVDTYTYVSGIIQLHQNTLAFTDTVNETFSILFLYILIVNMATLPLCSVCILTTLSQPFNCLRFAAMLIMLVAHLFMLFWPGQNVLDHGTELMDNAYYNEWYLIPLRTQKLIVILMIRCLRPIALSAGGIMFMNFETFSHIVRTAISYIAVVASFR